MDNDTLTTVEKTKTYANLSDRDQMQILVGLRDRFREASRTPGQESETLGLYRAMQDFEKDVVVPSGLRRRALYAQDVLRHNGRLEQAAELGELSPDGLWRMAPELLTKVMDEQTVEGVSARFPFLGRTRADTLAKFRGNQLDPESEQYYSGLEIQQNLQLSGGDPLDFQQRMERRDTAHGVVDQVFPELSTNLPGKYRQARLVNEILNQNVDAAHITRTLDSLADYFTDKTEKSTGERFANADATREVSPTEAAGVPYQARNMALVTMRALLTDPKMMPYAPEVMEFVNMTKGWDWTMGSSPAAFIGAAATLAPELRNIRATLAMFPRGQLKSDDEQLLLRMTAVNNGVLRPWQGYEQDVANLNTRIGRALSVKQLAQGGIGELPEDQVPDAIIGSVTGVTIRGDNPPERALQNRVQDVEQQEYVLNAQAPVGFLPGDLGRSPIGELLLPLADNASVGSTSGTSSKVDQYIRAAQAWEDKMRVPSSDGTWVAPASLRESVQELASIPLAGDTPTRYLGVRGELEKLAEPIATSTLVPDMIAQFAEGNITKLGQTLGEQVQALFDKRDSGTKTPAELQQLAATTYLTTGTGQQQSLAYILQHSALGKKLMNDLVTKPPEETRVRDVLGIQKNLRTVTAWLATASAGQAVDYRKDPKGIGRQIVRDLLYNKQVKITDTAGSLAIQDPPMPVARNMSELEARRAKAPQLIQRIQSGLQTHLAEVGRVRNLPDLVDRTTRAAMLYSNINQGRKTISDLAYAYPSAAAKLAQQADEGSSGVTPGAESWIKQAFSIPTFVDLQGATAMRGVTSTLGLLRAMRSIAPKPSSTASVDNLALRKRTTDLQALGNRIAWLQNQIVADRKAGRPTTDLESQLATLVSEYDTMRQSQ